MSTPDKARIVTLGRDELDAVSAVCAIGMFDGVHLGHRALIDDLVVDASFRGLPAVVVTFDPDPDEVLAGVEPAPRLTTHARRVELLAETGVDLVAVVPFTPELAAMHPRDFLDTVLTRILVPVAVHVGVDFRFGAGGVGDASTLRSWTSEQGGLTFPYPLFELLGAPVTATRIRALIDAGAVDEAATMLGRRHAVAGTVVRGRGEGRALGFPTANIRPASSVALPAEGVYAGTVDVGGAVHPAAVSVGVPPTFPQARDYLEAHILDFDSDIYDEPVEVRFVSRIREQRAFASLPLLTAAIASDVEEARRLLS